MNRAEYLGVQEFKIGSKWKLTSMGSEWNSKNKKWQGIDLILFHQIRIFHRTKQRRYSAWTDAPEILWCVSTSDYESPCRMDNFPTSIIKMFYEPL